MDAFPPRITEPWLTAERTVPTRLAMGMHREREGRDTTVAKNVGAPAARTGAASTPIATVDAPARSAGRFNGGARSSIDERPVYRLMRRKTRVDVVSDEDVGIRIQPERS